MEPVDVVTLGDGWASWTFELDQSQIAQFPRSDAVARGHARERRLLPELARHVTFSVPEFRTLGKWQGLPFHVYEKLRGSALTEGVLESSVLGAMLRELHSFPLDRARELLGDAGTVDEWRIRYETLWRDVDARVLALLSPRLARQLEYEYAIFPS